MVKTGVCADSSKDMHERMAGTEVSAVAVLFVTHGTKVCDCEDDAVSLKETLDVLGWTSQQCKGGHEQEASHGKGESKLGWEQQHLG